MESGLDWSVSDNPYRAQYLSAAELEKKRKLTPTEIEKLKNECYKQNLKTSFDHKMYNDG